MTITFLHIKCRQSIFSLYFLPHKTELCGKMRRNISTNFSSWVLCLVFSSVRGGFSVGGQ